MNQNIEWANCVYFRPVFVQYVCISHLHYMTQKALKSEVHAKKMRIPGLCDWEEVEGDPVQWSFI